MKINTYSENITQYQLTMATAKKLHKLNIINDDDFSLIEEETAKKYCIKKDSLYRANDLINNRFRVIYILPKKEDQNGSETDNKDRCITKVTKEN